MMVPNALATTPNTINYQGRLLDSSGDALTGDYDFRFSLWSDADWDAGDVDGMGAIEVGAAGYEDWQETHTVTVGDFGLFNIDLGDTTPFPSFNEAVHKYLQVEVKAAADPDTSYEVLDPDGDVTNITDRKTLQNQAYANNADTVDNASVGTGAGNLATLGLGGVWDIDTIPGGTNLDNFVIDENGDAAGNILLQFGNDGTDASIAFDNATGDMAFAADGGDFSFTGDLTVDGNIIISGTVDGVDISNLQFTDIGVRTKKAVLAPEYPNTTLEPDGADNRGRLDSDFIDAGGADKRNFYEWNTQQGALQDMDVVVSFELPLDFVSFTASPLEVTYQTSDGVLATNRVDVALYDTTGAAVALIGGGALADAAWTTASITFDGAPTFTAGESITLHLKLSATSGGYARISNVALNYNGR